MVKRIGKVLIFLVLLVAGVLGTMRLGWWNPSYESVKAHQAAAPSRFEQHGTPNLHIRDKGEGPVTLMLHSSMTNLREWDAWADALKGRYRVIRFDWPPYGLSIDSAPSTDMPGVLSLIEWAVAATGLKQFSSAQVTLLHNPDAGHYPMLELPQETGRDLGVWLDKVHAK
jgi:hypothetical protein